MRITTWNLLHGQGAENLRALANALDVGNSDFAIGVQEVDAYQDRSAQVFQVSDLASELSAKHFGFVRCVIGTPGFNWRKVRSNEATLITNTSSANDDNPPSYGIGLITNIPVKKWEVLSLGKSIVGLPLLFPAGDADSANATNGSPKPKLRFIYVKDEPRYAVAAQLENGFTVVNMHLSFVPFVNLFQLWRVKRWLAKMPGKHILLGDLNLPFDLPVKFSKWKSLISMASYPTWQPKIQFDYILSDNFAVDNSSKDLIKPVFLKSDISDHLPVTIEIN
ncbi:MAG: metal-dependent hydrolase [Actinobacteria bacterium]|nr:metal-dependent hydrolase [Actinomycetota bacterium]MDA2982029.1 metal-dependent hydrolase [Actinomycetota bacterium]MDA2996869.1 metal-dependent hydrolase [Actinomycetota bacterium]